FKMGSSVGKVENGPLLGDEKGTVERPFLHRLFGLGSKDNVAKDVSTKDSGSKEVAANKDGGFDRDKYLADLRAKKGGKDLDTKETKSAETKVADNAANKPAPKPPTVTPPKTPANAVAAKTPPKPETEKPQPSDWRKSWGKSESQAKDDDKAKTDK